jgi:hypothetical protein
MERENCLVLIPQEGGFRGLARTTTPEPPRFGCRRESFCALAVSLAACLAPSPPRAVARSALVLILGVARRAERQTPQEWASGTLRSRVGAASGHRAL